MTETEHQILANQCIIMSALSVIASRTIVNSEGEALHTILTTTVDETIDFMRDEFQKRKGE